MKAKCPKCGYIFEIGEVRCCLTCKWCRLSGLHIGCFYGYKWRTWIPQRVANVFPFCETPEGEHLKKEGCKWEGQAEESRKVITDEVAGFT